MMGVAAEHVRARAVLRGENDPDGSCHAIFNGETPDEDS